MKHPKRWDMSRRWYSKGKISRDHGPSAEWDGGSKEWYWHGRLIAMQDGTKTYLFRQDRVAIGPVPWDFKGCAGKT